MIGIVIGKSEEEIHADIVVGCVNGAFSDSVVVEEADRSEDFKISDFENGIVSK